MRTRARIRFRRWERVKRQAAQRIKETLNSDQRKVLILAGSGYTTGEIARELALSPEYVNHFTAGLIQRLTHDGLIPSPDWANVLKWAEVEGIILEENRPVDDQP